MLLSIRNLLDSFRPSVSMAVADGLIQLIRSASYTQELPPQLSSMIKERVFNEQQLAVLDEEIIAFCKEKNQWLDAVGFIIDSNNTVLLNQFFQEIPNAHLNILLQKDNIRELLGRAVLCPDVFEILLDRCQNIPSLQHDFSFWENLQFASLQAPKSLSILWAKVSPEAKKYLIHESNLLLEASSNPESLSIILNDVSPETYRSVITKRSLLHNIVAHGDISRLTAILSHLPEETCFTLLSEKDAQGKNVLDYLKPEQRPQILNLLRPDIGFVLKEKYRLKDNATHFFSIGNNKKIQLIEESLDKALGEEKKSPNDHKPITDNKDMKAALSHHRIFGFFGLKKTTAINHLETLEEEKSNKNFKS